MTSRTEKKLIQSGKQETHIIIWFWKTLMWIYSIFSFYNYFFLIGITSFCHQNYVRITLYVVYFVFIFHRIIHRYILFEPPIGVTPFIHFISWFCHQYRFLFRWNFTQPFWFKNLLFFAPSGCDSEPNSRPICRRSPIYRSFLLNLWLFFQLN